MSIKSVKNKVSKIATYVYYFVSFIFLIKITKIECWPVFKQDPGRLYKVWNNAGKKLIYSILTFKQIST